MYWDDKCDLKIIQSQEYVDITHEEAGGLSFPIWVPSICKVVV